MSTTMSLGFAKNIKKTLFMMVLALLVSCQSRVQPESDENFTVRIIDNGNAVEITGYKGTNTQLQLPGKIQNLPVAAIGERAFENRRLSYVAIPAGVTNIGNGAFAQNMLKKIILPNGLTRIGDGAFISNRLRSLNLPNSLNYIGTAAFADNRITGITIPNRITHIGDGAFQWNKISRVNIPGSVTYIGSEAFADNRIAQIPAAKDAGQTKTASMQDTLPRAFTDTGENTESLNTWDTATEKTGSNDAAVPPPENTGVFNPGSSQNETAQVAQKPAAVNQPPLARPAVSQLVATRPETAKPTVPVPAVPPPAAVAATVVPEEPAADSGLPDSQEDITAEAENEDGTLIQNVLPGATAVSPMPWRGYLRQDLEGIVQEYPEWDVYQAPGEGN